MIENDGFPQNENKNELLTISDWWGSELEFQDRCEFDDDHETDSTPQNVIGRIDDTHITEQDAQRIIEVLQYMIDKERTR